MATPSTPADRTASLPGAGRMRARMQARALEQAAEGRGLEAGP